MSTTTSSPARHRFLYAALVVLFILHNDLWLWNDGRLVLGLPVGLLYHIAYCLATSVALAVLVNRAWPVLESDSSLPEPPGTYR